MARLIPSDVSELALRNQHSGEMATLALLRKGLPATYTVFHGVHWSRTRRDGISFGELDFVVLNEAGDILVIEQKNGPLEEAGGQLTKSYGGADKSVGRQVHRALDNIRDKLAGILGQNTPYSLDYLVYLPDYRVRDLNSVGLDRERIVDAPMRGDLLPRIHRLLPERKDSGCGERIKQFFCDEFDVVLDIHGFINESERCFTRLTGGLSSVISNIEMAPLRLRVRGTAGCGKSHVALAAFQRALATGRHPLLLCFTRPLRERLNAMVPKGGLVQTWNGFCSEFVKAIGEKVDFEGMKRGPVFWREIQDKVIAAAIPENWLFDTIIVDEGQDFEQEWVDILRLFQKGDADWIWLGDPTQNVFRKPDVLLDGFVGYRANTNYRTPQAIATFIRTALDVPQVCGNELVGLGVGVHQFEEPEDQLPIIARIVTNLLKSGFGYEDIVVLSMRGTEHSILKGVSKVGAHTLKSFAGTYDMFGNQCFSEGKLHVDTVRRFKGQQAPAVILVDVDPSPESEQDKCIMFCGMTRATARLEIVANANNPITTRFAIVAS